ncbi:MAG: dihydroorotase [Ruminococcus sp.]|nr:dihydroorotase [Ruminococcus sp.]
MSILIKGARVVDPSQEIDKIQDILIENGRIKSFGAFESADEVINAEGLIAAPGLVDMHVHLRDPGQTHKEDILTGCDAAAAGGVTSLLCMPNTIPTVDNAETVKYIKDKAKQANAKVYVAASITKGLRSEEPTDLDELKAAGASALSDDGRPVEDVSMLINAMKRAPGLGMKIVAHCESLPIADGGIMNEGEISRALGVRGIPDSAEDCGTMREVSFAEALSVPVHICHVSTKNSVKLIRDAKKRGVAVTCETAPHYFTLTEKELLKRDADYRMNPPLRREEDRQEIIKGLLDGTIDAIATDHAPHSPEEKANFEKAPNGSIGMETSLSAGVTALVRTGKLTISELIEKMSTNPAKILGIEAGTLKEGAPADLVLFDINEEYTVDPEKLHGKSKNTPFKNLSLFGRVKYTLLDGKVVFRN